MSSVAPTRSAVPLLILAAAAWGLGTVISKRAVSEIPPLTLLPIQLAASVLVLAILMRWRGVPLRDASVPRGLGRLGLLNPGLAYWFYLSGLRRVRASTAAAAFYLIPVFGIGGGFVLLDERFEPVLILALAAWLLGERVSRGFAALSVAAIAGVLLVIYAPRST